MNSFERAKEIFEENGLEYSKELHEKLEIYYNFLVEYNEKVNLTAITEKEDVWIKHDRCGNRRRISVSAGKNISS